MNLRGCPNQGPTTTRTGCQLVRLVLVHGLDSRVEYWGRGDSGTDTVTAGGAGRSSAPQAQVPSGTLVDSSVHAVLMFSEHVCDCLRMSAMGVLLILGSVICLRRERE
jgi:hypothetical protein